MSNRSQQVNISRSLSIAALGLALLIAALLLWRTAQSAQFSAGIFGYPFQVDESEGMIAAETLLLDQGQNIYTFPGPQQFVAAPYPPVYYLLNLPFIHFTGYSLKVGRAITILSTLAAASLIFALVNIATRRRLAALIAALAFLANSLTAFWGAIVKPDVLAMAFALLGLYFVARYIQPPRLYIQSPRPLQERARVRGNAAPTDAGDANQQGEQRLAPTDAGGSHVEPQGEQRFGPTDAGRSHVGQQGEQRFAPTDAGSSRTEQQGEQPFAPTYRAQAGNFTSKLKTQNSKLIYLAALAFALAILTKQTSAAAAGAGFIVLLWVDWRRGLKAIALYLALVGGVSLLLDWQTAGGYYWHMVTVHALPWSFDRVVTYVQSIWSVNWPLLVMGAVGLLVGLVGTAKSLSPAGKPLVGSLWVGLVRGESGNPSDDEVGGAAKSLSPVGKPLVGSLWVGLVRGESRPVSMPPTASQRIRFSGETDSDTQHSALSTQHSALRIMLFLYGLAAVVQASGVGTLGGVHNHFLDAFSALCIGFGLLLGWLLDRAEDGRAALLLRVGGLIGIGVVAVLVWVLINGEYDPHDLQAYQFRLPNANQLDGMSHIAQFATNNGGLLYSDNVSLVLSAHQRPRSTDPYTQTHASNPAIHPNPADRWDERQIVADIRAKKFALIILADSDPCKSGGGGEESPAIAAAVCDSYKQIQRNVEYVYQAK